MTQKMENMAALTKGKKWRNLIETINELIRPWVNLNRVASSKGDKTRAKRESSN